MVDKWRIDIEELEDATYEVKEASETIEAFIKAYTTLIEKTKEEAEGAVFEAISINTEEEVKTLKKLNSDIELILKALTKYSEKIDDINPWTQRGEIMSMQVMLASKLII